MKKKDNQEAKPIVEKQTTQTQPLLQIAPLPKKSDAQKAEKNLRIHPEIYPLPVVETAVRLVDPRDFEIAWESVPSAGHIIVHIRAKGYEHDAEYLEYYFSRKLILASTTHYSQQKHVKIRTLFMQTAHNVTRKTWQALGWKETFIASTTEAKEAETPPEVPQTHDYKDISYVVDEANQKLLITVKAEVYGLPDVLSASAEMRRTGSEIVVDARTALIQAAVKLNKNDVKTIVTQFYESLETTAASVSPHVAGEEVGIDSPSHGQVERTLHQNVDVDVYPQIFPLSTIQLAALLVSDRFHVKIDGDPGERIVVNLKPKSPVDPDHVKGIFGEALIQASLDEYKLAYYEPIRSYFLKLALSFGAVLENKPLSSFFRVQKPNPQKLDYRMSVNKSEIYLGVSERKSARIPLFHVAWRLRQEGSFVFTPEGSDGICLNIQPKGHVRIEALREKLNRELQRTHMF
ncbi:MAG: hypothetical protein OXU51_25895 [Candidatus Poribacteria bacterium]|nr:hypothetical protein [Candidatus Poribacteria bacterium]